MGEVLNFGCKSGKLSLQKSLYAKNIGAMEKLLNVARIDDLRKAAGINQEDFAKKVGMSRQGFAQAIIRGSFDLKEAPIYADALGMEVDEFIAELMPTKGQVAEARAKYAREKDISDIDNPFLFAEALFERRAELAALLRTSKTAPKAP